MKIIKSLLLLLLFIVFAGCKRSFQIEIYSNDPDAGTVHQEGTFTYQKKQTIDLSVKINEGYQFVGWFENDILISAAPSFEYIVTKNATIIATFELKERKLIIHNIVAEISYHNENNDLYCYSLKCLEFSFKESHLLDKPIFAYQYQKGGWVRIENHQTKILESSYQEFPLFIGTAKAHHHNLLYDCTYVFGTEYASSGKHFSTESFATTNCNLQFTETEDIKELELLFINNFLKTFKIIISYTFSYK